MTSVPRRFFIMCTVFSLAASHGITATSPVTDADSINEFSLGNTFHLFDRGVGNALDPFWDHLQRIQESELPREPSADVPQSSIERAKVIVSEALTEKDQTIRLAKLKNAVSLAGNADIPHYFLALEFRSAGELERAIREFEACLDINDKFLEALIELGETRLQSGLFSEAEGDFERAKQLAQTTNEHFGKIPFILARIKISRIALARDNSQMSSEDMDNFVNSFLERKKELEAVKALQQAFWGEPDLPPSQGSNAPQKPIREPDKEKTVLTHMGESALEAARGVPPSSSPDTSFQAAKAQKSNAEEMLLKSAIALLELGFSHEIENENNVAALKLLTISLDLLYYASINNGYLQHSLPWVAEDWKPQLDRTSAQNLAEVVSEGQDGLFDKDSLITNDNSWVLRGRARYSELPPIGNISEIVLGNPNISSDGRIVQIQPLADGWSTVRNSADNDHSYEIFDRTLKLITVGYSYGQNTYCKDSLVEINYTLPTRNTFWVEQEIANDLIRGIIHSSNSSDAGPISVIGGSLSGTSNSSNSFKPVGEETLSIKLFGADVSVEAVRATFEMKNIFEGVGNFDVGKRPKGIPNPMSGNYRANYSVAGTIWMAANARTPLVLKIEWKALPGFHAMGGLGKTDLAGFDLGSWSVVEIR